MAWYEGDVLSTDGASTVGIPGDWIGKQVVTLADLKALTEHDRADTVAILDPEFRIYSFDPDSVDAADDDLFVQPDDVTGAGRWISFEGSLTAGGDYYTKAELNSTTGGSEGASLIGTDTKTNLNSATTLEVAVTELDARNPPKRSTGAGNPTGVITGIAGDIYIDTTGNITYMHYGATSNNTSWKVI